MPRSHLACVALIFLTAAVSSGSLRAQSAREQTILKIQQEMQQNNTEAARQSLLQASRKYPRDAGFDNLLGILEAQQKNYRAAEIAFQRAVTRSPKFTSAWLNLGRLHQENARASADALPRALQAYLRVLQYEPANAEANYQCALLRLLRGEYQASLRHLAKLPETLQSNAPSVALLCANYAGIRDKARASEAADFLLTLPQLSEADVFTILPVLEKSQMQELGVKLLEGLQQRGLASSDSWHHLGLLYEQSGKLAEARATLEKAATKDRPLPPVLIDLARVAQRLKDHEGALGYLAHARDLEPQNARIHYLFGAICTEMNLAGEAHASLSKAVSLEPDNAEYNYAIGVISTFRRDPTEALPYLRKYLRSRSDDPRGHLWLGIAYFKSKNFTEARREFSQIVAHRSTEASARYYLGSIARQENRLEEAERELQMALKLQPDYADAHAELGQCYLQQRKNEQAAIHLHRAVETDPNHYTANFHLLTLYTRLNDARREQQQQRFEEIRKHREARNQESLRGVEVKPEPQK